MKYCQKCTRMTLGEPLFCNHCGCSYDVKLCPRHHPNPRNAEACSQCGSRDLSTPHPKIPFWKRFLIFLLMQLPVFLFLIGLISVAVLTVKHFLFGSYSLLPLMLVAVVFGHLLLLWMLLPEFLKNGIRWMFGKAKRGGKQ